MNDLANTAAKRSYGNLCNLFRTIRPFFARLLLLPRRTHGILCVVLAGHRCRGKASTIDYNSRGIDFALSISDQSGHTVWCQWVNYKLGIRKLILAGFLNVWSIPQIDVNRVVLDLFKFILVINEKQRFSEHNWFVATGECLDNVTRCLWSTVIEYNNNDIVKFSMSNSLLLLHRGIIESASWAGSKTWLTTPWVKKTRHQTHSHNFTNYYAIFKNFSLSDSVVNLQQTRV